MRDFRLYCMECGEKCWHAWLYPITFIVLGAVIVWLIEGILLI